MSHNLVPLIIYYAANQWRVDAESKKMKAIEFLKTHAATLLTEANRRAKDYGAAQYKKQWNKDWDPVKKSWKDKGENNGKWDNNDWYNNQKPAYGAQNNAKNGGKPAYGAAQNDKGKNARNAPYNDAKGKGTIIFRRQT